MKKTPTDRNTKLDRPHTSAEAKSPHDREQLRRRLLKMILQNEAQRRSAESITSRPARTSAKNLLDAAATLAVFDPEDFIGKELAASHSPQKPA